MKYQVRAAKRKAQGKDPGSKPSSERYAIIPGKPDESSLVERIMSDDEDEIMPPIDSHLSLNEKEKKLIYDWIAQGAKYDKHWAFITPEKASLPPVNNSQWPRNEIDTFVLEKLQKEKVKPNPELNKIAWLRRVTQDITGLPPSLEEIKSFRFDQSSSAYEKVVERLLNSDHYAERMANIWMDNARYADSNGYQFDNARTMWPWRDWVIKAFQENKPWNEFVTEQLAGDLLPSPSQAQLIATGFLRNHGYSIEGGIIDEEYRVDYAKDKTHTVGTLFLGLTMECTSCHDHKYDPLSMKDYYSLYAFFNTSAEKGAPGEKGRTEASAHPYINLGQKKSPLRVMIMKQQARESFILKQGLYDQPGEKVEPETPNDWTITKTPSSKRDIILSDPKRPINMLVRILNADGFNKIEAPDNGRRLKLTAQSKSPGFVVLLYPFRDGEELPKSHFSGLNGSLKIKIGEQLDSYKLQTLPKRRTQLIMQRNGTKILTF